MKASTGSESIAYPWLPHPSRPSAKVGYQGWVSVEVFDYTPGVERLTRESIDYMLGCLERLAG